MLRNDRDEPFGSLHAFDLPGDAGERRALLNALVEAQYWGKVRTFFLWLTVLVSLPALLSPGPFLHQLVAVLYAGLALALAAEIHWRHKRRRLLRRHEPPEV